MRSIDDADFVGKTVKSVTYECCNMWRFDFTDGTSLEVWAECTYDGIPYLLVDDVMNLPQ
jgi:hypothetical protein